MSYQDELRNLKLFGKKKEEKKVYRIPKKGVKKIAEEKAAKENGADAAMDKWFEDRRKEMTGICAICGGRTEKENDETYRRSIAHLFAKRKNMFPSIKLHPENWLELCFHGDSCHTNLDQHRITLTHIESTNLNLWVEILRKTSILYPVMTEAEKNKVPEILLTALNIQS